MGLTKRPYGPPPSLLSKIYSERYWAKVDTIVHVFAQYRFLKKVETLQQNKNICRNQLFIGHKIKILRATIQTHYGIVPTLITTFGLSRENVFRLHPCLGGIG